MINGDWIIYYTPDKRIIKAGPKDKLARYKDRVYREYPHLYQLLSPQAQRELGWEF